MPELFLLQLVQTHKHLLISIRSEKKNPLEKECQNKPNQIEITVLATDKIF